MFTLQAFIFWIIDQKFLEKRKKLDKVSTDSILETLIRGNGVKIGLSLLKIGKRENLNAFNRSDKKKEKA